jgi:hypothetical protein
MELWVGFFLFAAFEKMARKEMLKEDSSNVRLF